MGKEASPAIPSPAFYVWGAPTSEKPDSVSHLSTSSVNPNIIKSTISPIVETQKPAQQITPVPEYVTKHEPTNIEDHPLPEISESLTISQSPTVIDDSKNFPCLVDTDKNFPSLSSTANGSSSRGRGKKGKGKKGQQILTFGVQRMSIN